MHNWVAVLCGFSEIGLGAEGWCWGVSLGSWGCSERDCCCACSDVGLMWVKKGNKNGCRRGKNGFKEKGKNGIMGLVGLDLVGCSDWGLCLKEKGKKGLGLKENG